jgi:hypothetical protein
MNKKKPRRLSIEDARIARKASFWQKKYDDQKIFLIMYIMIMRIIL